jgi:putative PIN family toxin of toxin-antitoxin system
VKVFFDTNILVSAVATRGLCADIVNAALTEHRLIVGETVLRELRQVLLRKLRWPAAMANELETFLREHSLVIAKSQALDFRELDQDDLKVLGEAVAGKADVLVTGDQDLLQIATRSPIKIVIPRGFWELLRAG